MVISLANKTDYDISLCESLC